VDLGGDGMDTTDLGTPISSSDGDQVHLGVNEGTLDGNLDLLGDLDADTDVTLSVTDGDNSLESGSLSGLGLLLDGEDAHDLVGELVLGVGDESVNNGGFLDGDGVGVDLLEGLDLAGLNESSELGKGGPFVSLESTSSASEATSSSSASSATSVSSASVSASGSESSSTSIGTSG